MGDKLLVLRGPEAVAVYAPGGHPESLAALRKHGRAFSLEAEMKYVMFTNYRTGVRVPVIFSDYLAHSEIGMESLVWEATSAGFVSVHNAHNARDICFGESKSLGLSFAPGDSSIILSELAGTAASMRFILQDPEANLAALKKIRKEKRKKSRK